MCCDRGATAPPFTFFSRPWGNRRVNNKIRAGGTGGQPPLCPCQVSSLLALSSLPSRPSLGRSVRVVLCKQRVTRPPARCTHSRLPCPSVSLCINRAAARVWTRPTRRAVLGPAARLPLHYCRLARPAPLQQRPWRRNPALLLHSPGLIRGGSRLDWGGQTTPGFPPGHTLQCGQQLILPPRHRTGRLTHSSPASLPAAPCSEETPGSDSLQQQQSGETLLTPA